MDQPPATPCPFEHSENLDRLRALVTPMMQGRPYHNVRHVEACLQALANHRHLADDPSAVELAIWLHDAEYNPTRRDNEERSALLADAILPTLGYPTGVVRKVHILIMDTTHAKLPETPDGRLLVDIDLLVLSASEPAFDAYEDAIREEYRHVVDADFARGRARVLRHFLQRDQIYYRFTDREPQARRNLARAIAKWDAAVDGITAADRERTGRLG